MKKLIALAILLTTPCFANGVDVSKSLVRSVSCQGLTRGPQGELEAVIANGDFAKKTLDISIYPANEPIEARYLKQRYKVTTANALVYEGGTVFINGVLDERPVDGALNQAWLTIGKRTFDNRNQGTLRIQSDFAVMTGENIHQDDTYVLTCTLEMLNK